MLATARAEYRAQVDSPDVCTHVRQTPHLRTHPVPTSFRLPQTAAHMNEPRRKTASEISMSPLRIHACKCTPFFRQKERNAEQKYQQIIHLTLFPAPRSASPGKTGEKSALQHILQCAYRPMTRGRKQKKGELATLLFAGGQPCGASIVFLWLRTCPAHCRQASPRDGWSLAARHCGLHLNTRREHRCGRRERLRLAAVVFTNYS